MHSKVACAWRKYSAACRVSVVFNPKFIELSSPPAFSAPNTANPDLNYRDLYLEPKTLEGQPFSPRPKPTTQHRQRTQELNPDRSVMRHPMPTCAFIIAETWFMLAANVAELSIMKYLGLAVWPGPKRLRTGTVAKHFGEARNKAQKSQNML